MKLSRQQEREMYRRLNDPAKMRVVLKNIEHKQNREINHRKFKKRVLLVRITVGILLTGIVLMLLYVFG